VNRILPKQPRVRLDPELYERLRERVLRRDGWRCQSCGSRSNLEVHHKEFCSHGGDDSEQNLNVVRRVPLAVALPLRLNQYAAWSVCRHTDYWVASSPADGLSALAAKTLIVLATLGLSLRSSTNLVAWLASEAMSDHGSK